MECIACGTDGDVFDTDFGMERVVLFFVCFNEECENSAPGYIQYVYLRT